MDTSKIAMPLCTLLLIGCLAALITCNVTLQNAADEHAALQRDVGNALAVLNDIAKQGEVNEVQREDSTDSPEQQASAEAAVGFCLREVNDALGAFTADGYLVRLWEVSVSALPSAVRERLQAGVAADSWEEIERLARDFTS